LLSLVFLLFRWVVKKACKFSRLVILLLEKNSTSYSTSCKKFYFLFYFLRKILLLILLLAKNSTSYSTSCCLFVCKLKKSR
jgi:hypothetical protein